MNSLVTLNVPTGKVYVGFKSHDCFLLLKILDMCSEELQGFIRMKKGLVSKRNCISVKRLVNNMPVSQTV